MNVEPRSGRVAPGEKALHYISADVDADAVQLSCHTESFDVDGFLVVRRDVTFPILLNTRTKLSSASAYLVYEEGKNEVNLDSKVNGNILKVLAGLCTILSGIHNTKVEGVGLILTSAHVIEHAHHHPESYMLFNRFQSLLIHLSPCTC